MEDSPINKTYRLTLDFTVWMNDEILHPYSDEDELDTEEKQQLRAQRSLLRALLDDKRGILEELIRKRVLEDADGAVDIYELRDRLLLGSRHFYLPKSPLRDLIVREQKQRKK